MIHKEATFGLRVRPGTLDTDVIVKVKHCSSGSSILSDVIGIETHCIMAVSVISKLPLFSV